MLKLAADILLRPAQAVAKVGESGRWQGRALGLYGLYLATAVLFYWLKPSDFPPPQPGAELGPRGLLFWARVFAWEPVLSGIWIVFAAWFGRILRGGRLPLRLPLSVACLLGPGLLIALHSGGSIGRGGLAAGCVLLVLAMAPVLRRIEASFWRSLGAWLLAVHVTGVALLPLFGLSVAARAEALYYGLEIASLFWTLGLATYGVSRLAGLPAARAFAAVFLSLVAQLLAVFILRFLDLLPADVLKAMIPA